MHDLPRRARAAAALLALTAVLAVTPASAAPDLTTVGTGTDAKGDVKIYDTKGPSEKFRRFIDIKDASVFYDAKDRRWVFEVHIKGIAEQDSKYDQIVHFVGTGGEERVETWFSHKGINQFYDGFDDYCTGKVERLAEYIILTVAKKCMTSQPERFKVDTAVGYAFSDGDVHSRDAAPKFSATWP